MSRIKIYVEDDEVCIKGAAKGLESLGRAIISLSKNPEMAHTHIVPPVFPVEEGSLRCAIECESESGEVKPRWLGCIVLLVLTTVVAAILIFI